MISSMTRFSADQCLGQSRDMPASSFEGAEVDKRQVAMAFSRAAPVYKSAAQIQQRISQRLLREFESYIHRQRSMALESKAVSGTPLVLDLGAGAGFCSEGLVPLLQGGELISLDIAEGMLREMPGSSSSRAVVADFDYLPIADNSVDWVFSSMSMQWSNSPSTLIQNIKRVLKPGGVLVFSTLLDGSLSELQEAWRRVDGDSHGLCYPDSNYWRGLLTEFSALSLFEQCEECGMFADARELLNSVKHIGASDHRAERNSGFIGRQRYQRFLQTLEEVSWRAEQRDYALSYQVLYVIAQN